MRPVRCVLCFTWLAGACGSDGDVTAHSENAPPTAAFGTSCVDLTCNFSDSSSDADGRIAGYQWSFGDQSLDQITEHAEHTYVAGGTYIVGLTVTDDDGATSTITHNVKTSVPNMPPLASFRSSCVELTCTFTDESSDPEGAIVNRRWTFGDGTELEGEAGDQTHTYANTGSYTVGLVITDERGASALARHEVAVVAAEAPAIAFTKASLVFCFRPSSTRSCAVLSQQVGITSTGPKALKWTAATEQSWLVIRPRHGTTPTNVVVNVLLDKVQSRDPVVSGSITVSAPGAVNSPQTLPVRLCFDPMRCIRLP